MPHFRSNGDQMSLLGQDRIPLPSVVLVILVVASASAVVHHRIQRAARSESQQVGLKFDSRHRLPSPYPYLENQINRTPVGLTRNLYILRFSRWCQKLKHSDNTAWLSLRFTLLRSLYFSPSRMLPSGTWLRVIESRLARGTSARVNRVLCWLR